MQFIRNIRLVILGLSFILFSSDEYGTKYSWQLLNDRNWQIVSNISEPSHVTDTREGTRGSCPTGMVEINGLMKQDPNPGIFSGQNIDALQKLACINWLNREPWWRDRCKEYDRNKWLQMSVNYDVKPMHFCIDRFEAGVNKGEYPPVLINYIEADQICKQRNKRLCTEDEWKFSCEGPEAIPYPYGYIRDENICVIDKKWISYSKDLFPRNNVQAMKELDKLWQGEPAGSRSKCRSVFGVYDLTGNVDEITIATKPESKYKLALQGGYWGGAVRNRCRATTRSHDESFAFYQVSYRCCKDL